MNSIFGANRCSPYQFIIEIALYRWKMGKRRKGEPVVRQNAKSKTTELSTLGSAFVQASDNEPSTSRRHSARLKPNTSSSSSLISSYEPSDSESAEGTECRVRERSVSNAEEAKLEKRKRGRPPGSRNRKLTSEKANSVGEKRLNATGNALPGRETEFNEISTKLGNSIKTGQGLCLCTISQIPPSASILFYN